MINIVPEPLNIKYTQGLFKGSRNITVIASNRFGFINELKSFLKTCTGYYLDSKSEASIEFVLLRNGYETDGYCIVVTPNKITLKASHECGLFYAYQTLKQLLLQESIDCCVINDKPNYKYRGFMLDVARYFYSVDDVKKIIDWCAMHKLNVLHLHLTDDQGWRVYIKKYPLLTIKGSVRSHTNFNITPHKGFYTQGDIKAIVAYAHKRFMTVVPEIDMPGHMRAAIACYPFLSCLNRPLDVATHWGVKHDILCGGKESVHSFICDVLDEIIELFPDKYIHLGGDEAVKTRWKLCPYCQEKIRSMGLKNENELQAVFMNRIAKYVMSKGRIVINWNEHEVSGILDTNITAQMWTSGNDNGTKIYNEINNGRKAILSTSEAYYIDLPYGYISLKKCYTHDPVPEAIKNTKNIIGIETTLWTEYVKNLKKAKQNTFPRLGAISERMWSAPENINYDNFMKKYYDYKNYLEQLGIKVPPLTHVNPTRERAFFSRLWFEKRQLTWEGLHNLKDNKKVKKTFMKQRLNYTNKTFKEKNEE